MYKQKTICKAVTLLGFLFLITPSCKKLDKKSTIEFTIKAGIPYNGMPVVGIKYKIREYRMKKFSKKILDESNTIWTDYTVEGRTGSDGVAKAIYVARKDRNYHIYFDYSEMEIPGYNGEVTLVSPPQFDVLQNNGKYQQQRDYEIRALPKMQVQWNFKNLSCVNSNDLFRYKNMNIDERPYDTFDSYPWLEGPLLNGCVDLMGNFIERLSGHYVFKWEAIRGGIVTTGIDTFLVSPNGNNSVNMFW